LFLEQLISSQLDDKPFLSLLQPILHTVEYPTEETPYTKRKLWIETGIYLWI
jgi:hypothetical protein